MPTTTTTTPRRDDAALFHTLEPDPSRYLRGWAWFSPRVDEDSMRIYQAHGRRRSQQYQVSQRTWEGGRVLRSQRLLDLSDERGVRVAKRAGAWTTYEFQRLMEVEFGQAREDLVRLVFPSSSATSSLRRRTLSVEEAARLFRQLPEALVRVPSSRGEVWERSMDLMERLHLRHGYDGWVVPSFEMWTALPPPPSSSPSSSSPSRNQLVEVYATTGECLLDITTPAFADFRAWIRQRTGVVVNARRRARTRSATARGT